MSTLVRLPSLRRLVGSDGKRMHPDKLTRRFNDSWTAPAFQEFGC